jgi:hypothetical protein
LRRLVSHRALYYPWTHVQDPRFLFESLLYWDRFACIVPDPYFEPNTLGPAGPEFARVLAEAHERFATWIVPSDEVKREVHERVVSLLDVPAPDWCRPQALPTGNQPIFISKLHHDTVALLIDRGWADRGPANGPEDRIVLARAAGCVVLSELVNAISTETLPPITDDPETFRGNCNALLWRVGAPRALDEGEGPAEHASWDAEASFLVTSFLRLAYDDDTPLRPEALSRLIALRGDAGFNELRERFCERVDQYMADMTGASSAAEQQVIADDWRTRLADDRRALVTDLRAARIKAVTEKDGLIATVAGLAATGGAIAALGPVGVVIGVGLAGLGLARSYRERRQEAMDQRWSSWLFAATRPRLKLL